MRNKRAIITFGRAERDVRIEMTNRGMYRDFIADRWSKGERCLSHRVLCASNNPKKVRELISILQSVSDISVVSPVHLGLDLEVEETGTTFAENAAVKAEAFASTTRMVCVADDSGLVIDALQGAPGIFSARYGGPGHTDDDRTGLVLHEMRNVPDELRTARFVCAIAVAQLGGKTAVFEGRVEGRIARRPAGKGGFGYDPIFFYPPFDRTFGEVDAEVKAQVSHRGMALRQAAPYLRQLLANGILEGR